MSATRQELLDAERNLRRIAADALAQADTFRVMAERMEPSITDRQLVSLLHWRDVAYPDRFRFWREQEVVCFTSCEHELAVHFEELSRIADEAFRTYCIFSDGQTINMHDPMTPIMRAVMVSADRIVDVDAHSALVCGVIERAAADKEWRSQRQDPFLVRGGEFLFGGPWGAKGSRGSQWGTETRWPQSVERWGPAATKRSRLDVILDNQQQQEVW